MACASRVPSMEAPRMIDPEFSFLCVSCFACSFLINSHTCSWGALGASQGLQIHTFQFNKLQSKRIYFFPFLDISPRKGLSSSLPGLSIQCWTSCWTQWQVGRVVCPSVRAVCPALQPVGPLDPLRVPVFPREHYLLSWVPASLC